MYILVTALFFPKGRLLPFIQASLDLGLVPIWNLCERNLITTFVTQIGVLYSLIASFFILYISNNTGVDFPSVSPKDTQINYLFLQISACEIMMITALALLLITIITHSLSFGVKLLFVLCLSRIPSPHLFKGVHFHHGISQQRVTTNIFQRYWCSPYLMLFLIPQ